LALGDGSPTYCDRGLLPQLAKEGEASRAVQILARVSLLGVFAELSMVVPVQMLVLVNVLQINLNSLLDVRKKVQMGETHSVSSQSLIASILTTKWSFHHISLLAILVNSTRPLSDLSPSRAKGDCG